MVNFMVFLRFVVIGFAELTIDDQPQLLRGGGQDGARHTRLALAEKAEVRCAAVLVVDRIGPIDASTNRASSDDGSGACLASPFGGPMRGKLPMLAQ